MSTPTTTTPPHSRNLLRNSLCIEVIPNQSSSSSTGIHSSSSSTSTFNSPHSPLSLLNHHHSTSNNVRITSPLSITSSTNSRARYSVVTCGSNGHLPNVTTDWDIKKIQEEIRIATMMTKNHTPSSSDSSLNTVLSPSNNISPKEIPKTPILDIKKTEKESEAESFYKIITSSRNRSRTLDSVTPRKSISSNTKDVDMAVIPNMSITTTNGQIVENIALSPFTKIEQPIANLILKFCTIYEFSALCRVTQQWNYFTKMYLKDFADSENLKTCLALLYCKLSQCLTDVVEFEDRPLKKVFQQLHQHRHLITKLPKIVSTPSSNTTSPLKKHTESTSSSPSNSQQQPLLPLHELFYESYISYFGTIVPRLAWHISRKNVKKRITFNEIQFHLTVEMFLRVDDINTISLDTYDIEQYIHKTCNSSFAAQLMTSVFAYFTVFFMRFDEYISNTVIAGSGVNSPILRKQNSSKSTSSNKKRNSKTPHDHPIGEEIFSFDSTTTADVSPSALSKKSSAGGSLSSHNEELTSVARKTVSSGILPTGGTSRRPSLKNLLSTSHESTVGSSNSPYLLSPRSPTLMMRNNSSSSSSSNSNHSGNNGGRRGSFKDVSPIGSSFKFDRGDFLISQQSIHSGSRGDEVSQVTTETDEVDVEADADVETFNSVASASTSLPNKVKYLEIVPKATCELGYMFLMDFFKIISRYCKKTSFNYANFSEAEKARIHYLSTLSISPYSDSAAAFMSNTDEGQVSRKNILKFKGICHAMADSEFITCLVMSGKEWNSEDVCILFNSFNLLEKRSRRDNYCVDLVLPTHIELVEENFSQNVSQQEDEQQHSSSFNTRYEDNDTTMVKWPSFLNTVYLTEMNESLIFHDRWFGEGPKIREIHLNLGLADSSLLTFGTLNHCRNTLRHLYVSECTLNYKIGSNFVNVMKELDLETLSLERFHLDSENWRMLFEDYLQHSSNSLQTIRLIDCINQLSDVSSFVHNIQVRSIQLAKVELKLKHFGDEEKGAVSGLLEHLLLNGNAKTIIADSISSQNKVHSSLSRKKKKGCIIS
ncbi:hypothetical protein C9374_001209 [Naegleria lovaniensis]|uniref:Uncharacterized protein n=1 Tax=Naegleria lovaniensis TaxID=51637 RepID=A0AA88GVE5_NAELO|nr:uncharacterized protein C9374_001209 [Naegleria lovaniensis]KAG2387615.1 hypothetical protein C9374_001209 [Naegleria lovaniensis]